VPGVVYGAGKESQMIELDHGALFRHLRMESFHASILDMSLDGTKERVLLRDVQMHPWKKEELHVDFQRVAADRKIHMRVPLHFIHADVCPGAKEGGVVSHVMNDVDIQCLPDDLPEFIEVDLSNLKAHETVRVLDLKLPAGVSPVLKGKENPVVAAVSTHGEATEEEAAAAPAAAEVPATAQKAPPPAAEAAKGGKEAKGGDKKK
jgi:large subunit ribosomal protein L25